MSSLKMTTKNEIEDYIIANLGKQFEYNYEQRKMILSHIRQLLSLYFDDENVQQLSSKINCNQKSKLCHDLINIITYSIENIHKNSDSMKNIISIVKKLKRKI
jgi:vacuolar-type H+-ATPase subunit C/Vma6